MGAQKHRSCRSSSGAFKTDAPMVSLHFSAAPSRPTSPEKFSVPHVCARFGPGGQLIKALPNLPSDGQPALVEVHSMEVIGGPAACHLPPVRGKHGLQSAAPCRSAPHGRFCPVGSFTCLSSHMSALEPLLWASDLVLSCIRSLPSFAFLKLGRGPRSCSCYWRFLLTAGSAS